MMSGCAVLLENRADEDELERGVLAGAGPKARVVGAATAARVRVRAMGEIFIFLLLAIN